MGWELHARVAGRRHCKHGGVRPRRAHRRTPDDRPCPVSRTHVFDRARARGHFNFCLYGSIFCLAIDLHRAHSLDPLDTGLALLPMTIVTGSMAFLSGRLVNRIGEWTAIIVGFTAGAGGALLIALTATGGVGTLIVSSLPIGVTAVAMPAMTAVAMSHAPRQRVGLASGVFNASRQTGGALGVAVLGALLTGTNGDLALDAAFLAAAGVYAGGVALALTGWRGTRRIIRIRAKT